MYSVSIHVVGDPRLLSNLRDAPAGMTVRVADGNMLPVTKIGDIQMVDVGFTIPGVHLAPGLKSDLISVRVLTRSRICTWFDGDRAMLYAGPELVGEAVAPQEKNGLYVLQSLSVPEIAAAASSGNGLDGEIKLVPTWCGASACQGQGQSPTPTPALTQTLTRGVSFPRSVSIRKNSKTTYSSMLCWLKAHLRARLLRVEEEETRMKEEKKGRTEGEGRKKGKN
jgi:hypothetical protein